MDEWLRDLQTRRRGKGIKSADFYRSAMESFLQKMCLTESEFREDAEFFISDFILYHPRGADRYLKALKSYCDFYQLKVRKSLFTQTFSAKYAHLRLSESQIAELKKSLTGDALFIFLFCLETGTRAQSIRTARDFRREGEYLTCVVTEAKQNMDVKKYILDKDLINIIDSGKYNVNVNIKDIEDVLKDAYKRMNLDPYFIRRPIHVLRHCCAHRWLERTNYDYDLVAKIIGWSSVENLRKIYGAMPAEVVERKVKGLNTLVV